MFKRDDVMTTRPASTSLLTIDSEDRFRDYNEERYITSDDPTTLNFSPYNFTISKPESMMNGFITRLAVSEIVFPYTIPNVNYYTDAIQVTSYDSSANVLQISIVQIDVGFYTPSELAAAVQAAVRTADATNLSTFTLSYNDTLQFDYAVTGGNLVSFEPLSMHPITNKPYPTTAKQLFDMLGFDNDNEVPSASLYGNVTLAQYTRYLDIVCPQLTYNQPLKDTSSQVVVRDSLCRVYLDQITGAFNTNIAQGTGATFTPTGCRPFMIYHNFTHPKQINWTPNQPVPGNLTFQVYDDSGELLDGANTEFSNTANWSMTLLVTEN